MAICRAVAFPVTQWLFAYTFALWRWVGALGVALWLFAYCIALWASAFLAVLDWAANFALRLVALNCALAAA